jgi:hypothetical protein
MRIAAIALVTLLLAGCGGHDSRKKQPPIVQSQAPGGPHLHAVPARPRDVALIRRWTDTLRAGHVNAAARLFHVPTLAENGTGELVLSSRAETRQFNASLPCGAELLEAKRVDPYTIATFRLTERPGPGQCGTGTGHEAATAFQFKNGRISEWRRVPVPVFEPAKPPRV